MNQHDRTIIQLALGTAVLEATKAVAETPADHPEYKGYVFYLSEFNRLLEKLNGGTLH